MRDAPDELVTVGVLTKPHGIRGELRIHAYNLESPLWDGVEELVLQLESGPRRCAIVSLRAAPKHLVARLEGVDTREAAEALRGVDVAVPRAALPPLEEGEFYFVDLIGLPVRRDGEEVGRVEAVLEYPSVECLAIRSADGVREVPMIEPWVVRIDPDEAIEVGPWDDVPVR